MAMTVKELLEMSMLKDLLRGKNRSAGEGGDGTPRLAARPKPPEIVKLTTHSTVAETLKVRGGRYLG